MSRLVHVQPMPSVRSGATAQQKARFKSGLCAQAKTHLGTQALR